MKQMVPKWEYKKSLNFIIWIVTRDRKAWLKKIMIIQETHDW